MQTICNTMTGTGVNALNRHQARGRLRENARGGREGGGGHKKMKHFLVGSHR